MHIVFTYRQLMQLVLDITGRKRPILSLPFALGILQGTVLERLPSNLFTVTRAQVRFPWIFSLMDVPQFRTLGGTTKVGQHRQPPYVTKSFVTRGFFVHERKNSLTQPPSDPTNLSLLTLTHLRNSDYEI